MKTTTKIITPKLTKIKERTKQEKELQVERVNLISPEYIEEISLKIMKNISLIF